MRICIDGMNLALQKGTGVAAYARTLCHALAEEGHDVNLLYGQALVGKTKEARAVSFCKGMEAGFEAPRPHPYEGAWWRENFNHVFGHHAERIHLSSEVKSAIPLCEGLYNIGSLFQAAHGFFRTTGHFVRVRLPSTVEVMHWTYPVPIWAEGARNVYTLHDLVPLLHPEMTLDRTELYRKLIRKVVCRADALCTVSETSKHDLEDLFPEAKGRIFNTYQAHIRNGEVYGLDEPTLSEIVHHYVSLRLGDYYIHYGQIEPKKNTARILQAFLASDVTRKLVLVGSTGWKNEDAIALLREGEARGRVVHIPYLTNRALFSLLRGARALFFPSLVEGFGLPVLEAFSLGTPVLTANNGALKEVAGDAALLVNPLDMEQMRQAMERLEADDALCFRLRRAGSKRQDFFSMSAYRRRLRQFYDNL